MHAWCAVTGLTIGVLKQQRTWASRIAGFPQGESATAIVMVQDDKWYDRTLLDWCQLLPTVAVFFFDASPIEEGLQQCGGSCDGRRVQVS